MRYLIYFLYSLAGLTVISCSSSSITLNVLVPADINVPSEIKSLAAINRSLPAKGEKFNNVLEGVITGEGLFIDRDASFRCIDGVARGLVESPRFTISVPPNLDLKGTGTGQWPIPLEWPQVEKICNDNKADALLVLETFDSNNTRNIKTIDKKRTENGKEIMYVEFIARLDVAIKAGWRIYEPKNKRIIDQNVYVDHLAFEKSALSEQEATKLLPVQRNATMDAGFYAGQQYSRRISPTYMNTGRSYYIRGNDNFKTAKRKVQTNQWAEAAEIWQKALSDSDNKVKGRAAYNLALAAEVEGKLDLAVEWAKKAYSDYGNKAARSYTNVLYRRLNDQERLKIQMEGQ